MRILYIMIYLIVGKRTLLSTFKGFINNRIIDENFLISISTSGALLSNHYLEGIFVMSLYELSSYYLTYTTEIFKKHIPNLLDVKLSYINSDKESDRRTTLTTFCTFYYVPSIIIISFLLAFAPPLFLGNGNYDFWIYRSIIFLILSNPCTLILAIPISFIYGISKEHNDKVLIKKISLLKPLTTMNTVIFNNKSNTFYECKLSLSSTSFDYKVFNDNSKIQSLFKSADIIIINRRDKIINSIRNTRDTLLVAKQNLVISLIVKVITLILGAFGFINMFFGIYIDLIILILIFLNSIIHFRNKLVLEQQNGSR